MWRIGASRACDKSLGGVQPRRMTIVWRARPSPRWGRHSMDEALCGEPGSLTLRPPSPAAPNTSQLPHPLPSPHKAPAPAGVGVSSIWWSGQVATPLVLESEDLVWVRTQSSLMVHWIPNPHLPHLCNGGLILPDPQAQEDETWRRERNFSNFSSIIVTRWRRIRATFTHTYTHKCEWPLNGLYSFDTV